MKAGVRRALLVSYFFPPRFSVGGKRAHRFARYLPECGWATTVLTARGRDEERLDPSFSDADLPSCDVLRDLVSPRELRAMPPNQYTSAGIVEKPAPAWAPPPRSPLGRLRAELRYVPVVGPLVHLVPLFARRIGALARRTEADVIFVTGPPWEPVVAAVLAARAVGLPLVADFRDPWAFGPEHARRPTLVRAANRAIERAVMRSAYAVTVTTETIREACLRLGDPRRIHTIRSGYDPEIRPAPRRDGRITLVHFGNCYGERNLSVFLRALAEVVRRRRLGPEHIRLLNLGRVAESDLRLAEALGVRACFEHRTVLPYNEGMEWVAGADLALIPGFGTEPWFIPGKFWDYVAARTPILAVAAAPELDELVRRTRLGWVHAPDDIAGLAARIEDAIAARDEGRALSDPDEDVIAALSARGITADLAGIFESACESRRSG